MHTTTYTPVRTHAATPFRPTERRLKALDLIRNYDGLTTSQICAIMGGSVTHLKDDLRLFTTLGLIAESNLSLTAELRRYITAAGDRLLESFGLLYPHRSELERRIRRNRERPSPHDQMVTDGTALLHMGVIDHPHLELRLRQQIIQRAAPKHRTASANPFEFPVSIKHPGAPRYAKRTDTIAKPDDVMQLVDTATNDAITLIKEDERTNDPYKSNLTQTSFFKKWLAYRYLASRPDIMEPFGIQRFVVIVTAYTQSHLDRRMRMIREFTSGKGDPMFLFKKQPHPHLPVQMKQQLPNFTTGWMRAGHDSVDLEQLLPC